MTPLFLSVLVLVLVPVLVLVLYEVVARRLCRCRHVAVAAISP
jgi:hypothetical protein